LSIADERQIITVLAMAMLLTKASALRFLAIRAPNGGLNPALGGGNCAASAVTPATDATVPPHGRAVGCPPHGRAAKCAAAGQVEREFG